MIRRTRTWTARFTTVGIGIGLAACGQIADAPAPVATLTQDVEECFGSGPDDAGLALPMSRICTRDDIARAASRSGACTVLTAEHVEGACTCDASRARMPVRPRFQNAATELLAHSFRPDAAWNCVCEQRALDLPAGGCRSDAVDGLDGWCFDEITETSEADSQKCLHVGSPGEIRFAGSAIPSGPDCVGLRVVCEDAP